MPAYHTCPNIGDCPENRIYYDGCCEQCNGTDIVKTENHSLCAPESLPSNQTVGLVTEDSPFHDTCVNTEPIQGFAECRGLCDSYTYFNKSECRLRFSFSFFFSSNITLIVHPSHSRSLPSTSTRLNRPVFWRTVFKRK